MLTATVTVSLDHKRDITDITFDHEYADRRALQYLEQVPDLAHLVVVVGTRTFLGYSAVLLLSTHVDRLDVEIDAADPWAARRWYDAIKTGEVM